MKYLIAFIMSLGIWTASNAQTDSAAEGAMMCMLTDANTITCFYQGDEALEPNDQMRDSNRPEDVFGSEEGVLEEDRATNETEGIYDSREGVLDEKDTEGSLDKKEGVYDYQGNSPRTEGEQNKSGNSSNPKECKAEGKIDEQKWKEKKID